MIPIPTDSKEVLTFEYRRPTRTGTASATRLSLAIEVTRRNGEAEALKIARIGDGYNRDAIIEVSKDELTFLSSIFAFFFEQEESNLAIEPEATSPDTPPTL